MEFLKSYKKTLFSIFILQRILKIFIFNLQTFVIGNVNDRIVGRHLNIAHRNLIERNAIKEFRRSVRVWEDVHFSK